MTAIPEAKAASRIASIIGTYLSPQWFTPAALEAIAAKVVANRAAVRSIFDELDADPNRLGVRDKTLRQQQVSHYSDEDQILERLHEIKRDREMWDAEEHLLYGYLHGMGSTYALPDRDERGADEDDARLSRERADEAAAAGMPKVAGL